MNCRSGYWCQMGVSQIYLIIQQYKYKINIDVKEMNVNHTTRTHTNKPVNINISFTINPKNILKQQSFCNESYIKNKKNNNQFHTIDKQLLHQQPKTPELLYTERVSADKDYLLQHDNKKYKKIRKGNSVDQTSLFGITKKCEPQKSINLYKQSESIHTRKIAVKAKHNPELTAKQKHYKTVSKDSGNQNTIFKGNTLENAAQLKNNYRKNLKYMINKMMTNELSKRSLTTSLPAQHNRVSRKKRVHRKVPREPKNEIAGSRGPKSDDFDSMNMNRKTIIEKLTSIRSMNDSIFKSEEDEQVRPRERRTMVINTDHSIDCIDEIHELEKQAKNHGKGNDEKYDVIKVKQTKDLIQYHIAMFNENMEYYYGQELEEEEDEDHGTVGRGQDKGGVQLSQTKKGKPHQSGSDGPRRSPNLPDSQQKQQLPLSHESQASHPVDGETSKKKAKQKLKEGEFQPFISSEMTKEQKVISEIERAKLNELKKHQVEKWGELLTFIKESMKSGKTNHDEILEDIYSFLEQSKMDLQKDIVKSPQKNKEELEDFTNQFPSNQLGNKGSVEISQLAQKSFTGSISNNQQYQQENQELKLMNLEMIENALNERHNTLLEKRNVQLSSLQQQKQTGKITKEQFSAQCEKLEKWTRKQTSEIMQARKTIWKGYNEAKGIIEKSLKSRYFHEQSAKKKSMMKCLSEDYLLKNYNYKKLLKPQESQDSLEQELKLQQRSLQEHEQQHNKEENSLGKCWEKEGVLENGGGEESVASQDKIEEQNQHTTPPPSPPPPAIEEPLPTAEDSLPKGIIQPETPLLCVNSSKPLPQLADLSSEDDISVIRQKLQDIKHRHLQDDLPERTSTKQPTLPKASAREVDDQQISQPELKIINQQLKKQRKESVASVAPSDRSDKLKEVLPEDKEDIFEFILLDLSIEIYQEPCHENRIMNSINNHVTFMKRQSLKKKGVKTNLTVVKEYLKRITGYILRVHRSVLDNLDEPVGPSAVEMLKYMHENDEEPAECDASPNPVVIPAAVFDMFEKTLLPSVEFEVYYESDEEKQNKRVQFLKNVLHIHNKALFDAMNEHLDLLKPFGIWGKPFPWKSSSSFFHPSTDKQKQEKLRKSSEKVIEHCSYVCGLLVDKQQSLVGNTKITNEHLQQIKEDRLSRMLASELVDNEERWLFYDDEETEVLMEISKSIYIMMVKQVIIEYPQKGKDNVASTQR